MKADKAIYLLGCRMRYSYAFNDILYGIFSGMNDEKLRETLSRLTKEEARLIRGRRLPNGSYASTFVLVWNYSRKLKATCEPNGLGIPVPRPTMSNSGNSKKTYEFCRRLFLRNHLRFVRLMRDLEFQDEAEWSFPKGRVSKTDINESRLETALREFYEETHCDLDKDFVKSRILRKDSGEYDTILETLVSDYRIFNSEYFVFVDPRPLSPMMCNYETLIDNNEIRGVFWRRVPAFIGKWTDTEPQKLRTIRELFRKRF